jgi:pSer/pThr/pTyr-binding forkhead associated (FHA) protein
MLDKHSLEDRLDQTEITINRTAPLKSPFNQTSKLNGKTPKCLRFVLIDGTELDVTARPYISLGRLDDKSKEKIDLDLNTYRGRENGVSRCHAIVSVTQSGVFLKDFNSKNGTFINSDELYPMREYALEDGDAIILGRLYAKVKFIF